MLTHTIGNTKITLKTVDVFLSGFNFQKYFRQIPVKLQHKQKTKGRNIDNKSLFFNSLVLLNSEHLKKRSRFLWNTFSESERDRLV